MKYIVLIDQEGVLYLNDEVIGHSHAGHGRLIFEDREQAEALLNVLKCQYVCQF